MRDSGALARRHGVRLHTHLAETIDEERFCRERFGMRPVELIEELGWIGDDVWFAHGVHLDATDVRRLSESHTGVAHCPSSNMRLGSGACPVEELVRAGVHVGLGVDGAASNEDANLVGEVHQALLLARVRAALLGRDAGAGALDARTAWGLASGGGAACLGRDDCGALEVGRCADVALYRVDDLLHTGIEDPLEALALAPPARAEAVVVNGRVVVREGRLLTADEGELASGVLEASRRLREAAGG
jgi:cytosine/adenosine deaminase-related metal-dependent hydrolase